MKLRNKKTGEIREYGSVGATTFGKGGALEDFAVYDSLAELNEEWEDYEEPKKYYVINPVDWVEVIGEIEYRNDSTDKINKEIGNYFETKEEAEKAVEKLKAWKRLEDKGFRFADFGYRPKEKSDGTAVDGNVSFDMVSYEGFVDDLRLLFGGEDE